MGSGAYGVVMSVRIPSVSHPFVFLFCFFLPSSSQCETDPFYYLFDFDFKSVPIFNQHPIIVSSAADEISGETVAIKMVTRVFAKATLAKRALRELALLRHFNNHENITGLIDVDGIAETFNEM